MRQVTATDHLFPEFAHQSRRALSRNANVFIWWRSIPVKDVIMACFNDEAVAPLPTAPTLIRWFEMLTYWRHPLTITPLERLNYVDCLLFKCKLPDDRHPLDHSTVLTRGDYACCYTGPTGMISGVIATSSQTFTTDCYCLPGTLQFVLETHAALEEQTSQPNAESLGLDLESPDSIVCVNAISPELRNITCEKFGRKCIFTGSTGDTGDRRVGAHWIYPPAAYGRASVFPLEMVGHVGVYRDMGAMDLDAENIQVASNLVTMRADVHRLWLANAISIDVDDGYRVIVFDKTAHAVKFAATLKFAEEDRFRDDCFREHFRYTLAIHIVGGHLIPYDFCHGDVNEFLDNVKYAADGVTPRPKDLERKKWRTRIGKLALQHIQTVNPTMTLELPEHLVKGGSLEDDDTDESADDEEEDIVTTEDECD
ncbi:hypothetical protein VTO73DRAFT_2301 [Trametes versicolor]